MVQVALKLRADILSHPHFQGFEISKHATFSCMPDNLFMFLKILYGGQDTIENCCNDDCVLSAAQDIIYSTSNGKMWMTKHIGLASTLH